MADEGPSLAAAGNGRRKAAGLQWKRREELPIGSGSGVAAKPANGDALTAAIAEAAPGAEEKSKGKGRKGAGKGKGKAESGESASEGAAAEPTAAAAADRGRVVEKIELFEANPRFELRSKILGDSGDNIFHIQDSSKAQLRLLPEALEPTHLEISAESEGPLRKAVQMAQDLLAVVQEEYFFWLEDEQSSSPPLPSSPASPASPEAPAPAEDGRARLVRQVKAAEQRAEQRRTAAEQVREEIQRLQREAALSLQDEGEMLGEAADVRAQADEHEETLRSAEADLMQRVEEHERQAAERRAKERDWREELESMEFQKARAAEEVENLEANAARWRRSAADQAARVTKAEAMLKRLEEQRQDLKSRGGQLRGQLEAQIGVTEEAIAAVEELEKRERLAEPDSLRDVRLWQAASGLLVLLLAWLLFVEWPGAKLEVL